MRLMFVLAVPVALAACSSEPTVTATNASVSDVQNQVKAAGADVKVKPGRWEGTMTVKATLPKGMPDPGTQTQPLVACITPEQVKEGSNPFSSQLQAGCKYDKFTMGGGKIDATMTCTQPGMTIKSTVKGEFSEESYSLKSSGDMTGPMGNIKTDSTMDAKRTGDCRGDEMKAPKTPAAPAAAQ